MKRSIFLSALLAAMSRAGHAAPIAGCDPSSSDPRIGCQTISRSAEEPPLLRFPVQQSQVALDPNPSRPGTLPSRFELVVSSWVTAAATTETYIPAESGYRAE